MADSLLEDAPTFVRDYHDYCKILCGYHLRSLNSNEGWNVVGTTSFFSQPLLAYIGEIRTPVPVIHGEKTHSRYMGERAFAQLIEGNKELFIVSGAGRMDLCGGGGRDATPFDGTTEFFRASPA